MGNIGTGKHRCWENIVMEKTEVWETDAGKI